MRHRIAIRDLSMIAAATLVALYWVYVVDVFPNDSAGYKANTIELDEALLIGGGVATALLGFAIKQYRAQRREVALRVAAERHVRELAYQDGLTGLPNRRQFDEALNEALGSPPRSGAVHALFLLDMNGFKQINDVHGHSVGDEVLVVVARHLLGAIRGGDVVARFGGDEFAILATHLIGPEAATNIALRIIESFEAPIDIRGVKHTLGAGIGIALLPTDAVTSEEAVRKADVALYRAKAERRSALRFFEEEMDRRVRERADLEDALRAAVAADALEPMFLPTVHMMTREVIGFEMIPQWVDENGETVPTERFIPIAEDAGLIHQIADRMLRKACLVARAWPSHVRLSTDLYPSQLKDEQLVTRMLCLLQEVGFPPQRLELEITESALVADIESARRVLSALRGAGIGIALDNFGTGYSSLYHLRSIEIDKVKIDRSFTQSISERGSASVVRALVGLGRGLGLTVVAEGVDDLGQDNSLIRSGCDIGQGSMFSGPVDAQQSHILCSQSHDDGSGHQGDVPAGA